MKNKVGEDKRQINRKKNEKTSRLLDNYYNPNIHKKFWEPSGTIKQKNKYVYGDSGLAHNITDVDISKKENNKQKSKEQIHFLEFDYLEDNDVIIIIEHCSNCEKHLNHTNHSNDIFKYITKLLQVCINTRFPFIKVYLKPIDTSNNKINRIGALEIQIGMKINNQTIIETLFSKLNTGQWPNFHNVLNKINMYVPVFNFKLQIYDKEEGEYSESTIIDNSVNESKASKVNIKNNNNNELFKKPSKYENIKINLYSYNCEQIENYCKEAANALDAIYNSKRKLEIYHENALNEANINSFNNNNNTKLTKGTNTLNNTTISMKTNVSSYNNNNTLKKGEIIEDMSIINQMKGKLLCSGYTDKLGFLFFENVPFDSYIVEIESSKKFLGCGALIQFKKIYQNMNVNENYIFSKIFGLKRQVNAYIEVYLFSNTVKDNKFEINFISGAKVLLKKNGETEDVVELKENIKGRYDIVVEPCYGVIVVIQNGKEIASKEVALNNGLNKVNIEI
jgi:hypothetical protein